MASRLGFPDERHAVVVEVRSPGAPDDIERTITILIERVIHALDGVASFRSDTVESHSRTFVWFANGLTGSAVATVRLAVGSIQAQFPSGTGEPVIFAGGTNSPGSIPPSQEPGTPWPDTSGTP